jgi:intracellular multiplication protein IcmE
MNTTPNNQIDDFDTDLGFDEPPAKSVQNRNIALLKVGGIALGLIVVIVGLFAFTGGGTPPAQRSEVPPPPEPTAGTTTEITPAVESAVLEYNQDQIEQARNTGDSFISIPTEKPTNQLQTMVDTTAQDQTEQLRQLEQEYTQQRLMQDNQNLLALQQAEEAARLQRITQMSSGMSSYLNSANSSRQPASMNETEAGFTGFPVSDDAAEADITNQSLAATVATTPEVLIPAASIEYGQLLIEANTDAQGPVLALIASGKLSGARLLGTFSKTDEYITLNFNQAVTKDGTSIPVDAIALDPDTTLPGMVTEINRRYFQRYILPAAADFISGGGEALAETQTTTNQNSETTETSSDDPDFDEAIAQGISDSFDGLGDVIRDQGRRTQPMLRIAAGTPIGILFTQPVKNQSVEQAAVASDPLAGLGLNLGGPSGVSNDTADLIRQLIESDRQIQASEKELQRLEQQSP